MTALGGHINHLYEDLDLRFRDLKNIFKILGHADIDVYEKFDGQNLFIGWNFESDKLKVARNKQNIKDGGLDKYGLSLKFGDRPEIESLFVEAYEVLSEAIGSLDHKLRVQIFGSMGTIWYPIEIINPSLPNTIHYSDKAIIFHRYNPTLFGFDGNPISTALPRNLEMLKQAIPAINNSVSLNIVGLKKFPLTIIDESIVLDSCSKISNIQAKRKIGDGTSIRSYAQMLLFEDMQRFPLVPEHVRSGVSKAIVKMNGSPSIKTLLMSVGSDIRKIAKQMIEEEKNFVFPKILAPIENIVHKFSSALLSNFQSEYIDNIEEESIRIKKEYDRCCDIIRNRADQKQLDLLNSMSPKIGTGKVTMEGLVFEFDKKIYKITGSFAPMNRIIATIRYDDYNRKVNFKDVPLSLFVQSS